MASPGAQFCPNCGSNVAGFAQSAVSTSQSGMGYAPATYSPAPTAGAGPRASVVISIVLGVLLVAVSTALIIVLVGKSGSSAIKQGMSPGETLKTVYKTGTDLFDRLTSNSFSESDLLTAYATMLDVVPAEKVRDRLKIEVNKEGGIPSLEVVDEEINGDRAMVTFRIHSRRNDYNGYPSHLERIAMIKENGKWKFDVMREWR